MDGQVADFVGDYLAKSRATIEALCADSDYQRGIVRVAELWVERLGAGQMLLFCGNGGSAADAQHIAGELVSRFLFDRPGMRAIALSTDTSILTSCGNDYGYDYVFARQVEALGRPGDVLTAISTSGNSANVVRAVEAAKARGLTVVGLTGGNGGRMAAMCDEVLVAPSPSTPNIQEAHLVTYHLLCALVEARIYGDLVA